VVRPPPLAGAAHPRLDLVGDEGDVVLVGEGGDLVGEGLAREAVAALALDGFEDEIRDVGGVKVAAVGVEHPAEL
jgi:hypothetical protein